MKKVLVAGAALLIAGSMVSAASAEVTLSGDARARYVGKSDYKARYTLNDDGTLSEDTNGYDDKFDSRIRVKFDAKAKGGAFMKARIRFDDFKWNGQGWGAWNEDKNIWTDYAFIGVPMGPTVLTAGRMPANFSKFFGWDLRPTRVKLDYKVDNLRLIGVVDVVAEDSDNALDDWNDNDFMGYGLIGSVKINDDWSLKGYARYHDDQREYTNAVDDATGLDIIVPRDGDRSGFLGAINTTGKIGTFGVQGDLAYKAADVQGTEDDGWGWNLIGSMDMGAFTPALVIGGTYDGYLADDDFGFIMIGAAEPITVVKQVGNAGGDAHWIGLVANYQVSDQFKLAGNLVYVDFDIDAADRIADAVEISGSATYTISEGADLSYKLGYLSPSYDGRLNALGVSDDGMFGHYLRMQIKF